MASANRMGAVSKMLRWPMTNLVDGVSIKSSGEHTQRPMCPWDECLEGLLGFGCELTGIL